MDICKKDEILYNMKNMENFESDLPDNFQSLIQLAILNKEPNILNLIFPIYIRELEKFIEPNLISKAISENSIEILKVCVLLFLYLKETIR